MKLFDRLKYTSNKRHAYHQEDSTSDRVIGTVAMIAFILIVLFT